MDKVCNGFSDCPGGEDEKQCTALIDDEENIAESRIDLVLTKNSSKNHSETIKRLDQVIERDSESSVTERDTTTLYILPDNLQSERLINDKNGLSSKLINQELARNRDVEESNIEVAVSSRETSSNVLRNGLISGNNLHAKDNRTFPVAKVYNNNEIDNYNNKGILSIRKNGKWGKLCFINTNSLTQEQSARQVTWSIEDLAKAACKAITYQ